MNLFIYNPFSFGGNYDYIRALTKAYIRHQEIENVTVIMPVNAKDEPGYLRILLTDQAGWENRIIKKFYFLYRSIVNPLRFYRYLRSQKNGIVLFNDYDQLSSFLWVPLFKSLRSKFIFSVILHDPDRDNYLPSKSFSKFSMKRVMSLMDVAFYHGMLPQKEYYTGKFDKVAVPHGIYDVVTEDEVVENFILKQKSSHFLLSIIGNIREEKNYELVIRSLIHLPEFKLIIAGAKANSEVPVESYRQLVTALGLSSRVIFIEKFLSEPELHAVIKTSDIILLYYSTSFTSQSGILNLIAPYKKKILVADTPSALTHDVRRFSLGEVVPADNPDLFIEGVKTLWAKDMNESAWDDYISEASWSTNVDIAIKTFKQKLRN
ncbi:glycosyltransferase [Flavitalea sp.]|nr:glycosyltransferase [Flavitalea sp.]